MTGRPPMRVEIRTKNTAYLVDGPRGLVPLLDRLAIPRQYDWAARCWMVPAQRVADLVAFCQHDRRPVEVVEALF